MVRILLFILLFSTFGLQAQVNHPFIDTNSTWRLVEFFYDGVNLPPTWDYADASFEAATYQETDSLRIARLKSPFSSSLLVYIEEVNKGKVMVTDTNGADTILLYDFSVELGDSLIYRGLANTFYFTRCNYLGPQSDSSLLIVSEIDTIGQAGSERKVIHLERYNFIDTLAFPGHSYLEECDSLIWVEGVGKMTEPHNTIGGSADYSVSIDCFIYDEVPVSLEGYLDGVCTPLGMEEAIDRSLALYPNPTKGIIYIEGLRSETVQVFDLSGRLVLRSFVIEGTVNVSGLTPGMYVFKIGENTEKVIIH